MTASQNGKSLVLVDKVLSSLRASDFDTESAFGEVIDNSIQAGASRICISLKEENKRIGKNKDTSKVCTEIAFGDNGHGMDIDILHSCLQLGSSTRYNDRSGIGRFGVGATLGAISQCKRIEIFSRKCADYPWMMTYIDLDEIEAGTIEYIPSPVQSTLPEEYNHLIEGDSGTLVIWKKCDKIESDDASGQARLISTLRKNLKEYISRTYRKFINKGIKITLDTEVLAVYDPLYIMPDPNFPNDETAVLDTPIEIPWDIPGKSGQKSLIIIRTTLLPESLRLNKGQGGRKGRPIPRENRGISILRADREIAYSVFPDIQPSVEDNEIDRYWGCEISFEPDLDECWCVRNIKKGARPIEKLQKELKKYIQPVVRTYRTKIRDFWRNNELSETADNPHREAEDIAKKSGFPAAQDIKSLTPPETEKLLDILEEIGIVSDKKEEIQKKIEKQPFSIQESFWFGQEFFHIEYLGGRVVIVLNKRHLFFENLYSKLNYISDNQYNFNDRVNFVRTAIDLLLVAFAEAQRVHGEEELYDTLRAQWGISLRQLVDIWKSRM